MRRGRPFDDLKYKRELTRVTTLNLLNPSMLLKTKGQKVHMKGYEISI
jgi:hypothetical protein